jgi:hypothetical protein
VFTRVFWADTLSALARQGLQAALVVFTALQAGGLTGTAEGIVWSIVIPLVFTLVRRIASAAVPALGWQGVVGRAVAAAAGVAAGLAITSWADIVSTDWQTVGLAALGAAGAAVANYFLDPPQPAAIAPAV